ncbi:MAG TPA: M15 family metallopeptidase [Rhodanobacteraceae bacterium]|nr:M15 family metallopeptidase [Rhodanobacteraceae bacterium]
MVHAADAHAMTRALFAALVAVAFCKGAGAAAAPSAKVARADSAGAVAPCATSPAPASIAYMSRVVAMGRELGLPPTYPVGRGMRLTPEPDTLVEVGYDVRGRRVRMAPRAAVALRKMIRAAAQDGVRLMMISGFRTVAYQHRLVRGKLERGMSIEAALRINAAPGFSEHHSGCAVDLSAPGAAPADESFAGTRAYRWLQGHAGEYGFHLSYPPDNSHGIEFEPWHWRYFADAVAPASPTGALVRSADVEPPASAATIAGPDSE